MLNYGFRPQGENKSFDDHLEKQPVDPSKYDDLTGIDSETAYNLPGFREEEEKVFNEVVNIDEPGLDEGELMAKHELENRFELVDLAKACFDYVKGKSKIKPVPEETDISELADYYHDYSLSEEDNKWPLDETELARLTPQDKFKLNKILDELSNFSEMMADENEQRARNFNTESIIARQDQKKPDYSTIDQKRSEVDKLNNYYHKIQRAQKDLEALVAKAQNREGNELAEKKQKLDREIEKDLQRNLKEYSDFEIKVLQSCFDFLTHKPNVKRPTFVNQERVSNEQILEGAQEWAEHLRLPRAKFVEKEYKGQKQLVYNEYLKDGKRISYIANNNGAESGPYYFQLNPNNFRHSKQNPKLSFAQAKLLFSAKRKEKSNETTQQSKQA